MAAALFGQMKDIHWLL